jgi:phage terminase large subunit-like protein
MYNIGMLLYYFLFGRPLFDHEDVEISIHLKESIQEVPFPSHTKAIYTKKARLFIESCILGRFHHQEAVRQHPWINEASILL